MFHKVKRNKKQLPVWKLSTFIFKKKKFKRCGILRVFTGLWLAEMNVGIGMRATAREGSVDARVLPVPLRRRCSGPAARCSTVPSTAGRLASVGAGVPPSLGWCPSPSGSVSAPHHPGASAGRQSRRRLWSLAAPSRNPWCSGGPPPSRWRTGGMRTETSWEWGLYVKGPKEKKNWRDETSSEGPEACSYELRSKSQEKSEAEGGVWEAFTNTGKKIHLIWWNTK